MKKHQKKILIALLLFSNILFVVAQDVPEHISYSRIYDFLDELANEKLIEINSVVKPYKIASRNTIIRFSNKPTGSWMFSLLPFTTAIHCYVDV